MQEKQKLSCKSTTRFYITCTIYMYQYLILLFAFPNSCNLLILYCSNCQLCIYSKWQNWSILWQKLFIELLCDYIAEYRFYWQDVTDLFVLTRYGIQPCHPNCTCSRVQKFKLDAYEVMLLLLKVHQCIYLGGKPVMEI